jgi:hypothetical protein
MIDMICVVIWNSSTHTGTFILSCEITPKLPIWTEYQTDSQLETPRIEPSWTLTSYIQSQPSSPYDVNDFPSGQVARYTVSRHLSGEARTVFGQSVSATWKHASCGGKLNSNTEPTRRLPQYTISWTEQPLSTFTIPPSTTSIQSFSTVNPQLVRPQ